MRPAEVAGTVFRKALGPRLGSQHLCNVHQLLPFWEESFDVTTVTLIFFTKDRGLSCVSLLARDPDSFPSASA